MNKRIEARIRIMNNQYDFQKNKGTKEHKSTSRTQELWAFFTWTSELLSSSQCRSDRFRPRCSKCKKLKKQSTNSETDLVDPGKLSAIHANSPH